MAAQTKNLYLEQGATFTRSFTYYPADSVEVDDDGDVTIIGPPYDLTGCTARMQIRRRPGGTVLLSLSSDGGTITLGDAAGTVEMSAAETLTTAIPFRPRQYEAVYDLEIEFPDGRVDRVIEGAVTVSPDVTRSS